MIKIKKEAPVEPVETTTEAPSSPLSYNDVGWNDYVLSLLTDEEKIDGNPTVDGLRRVFELALNCVVVHSNTDIVQSPTPENEKRATVTHTLTYVLNSGVCSDEDLKVRSVTGSADVYWGNCDKIYRNHPVAVAETRAEGRALRRGLRLRKVVAAEELSSAIEDEPNGDSVNKIAPNQLNFMDTLGQRLNINILHLLSSLDIIEDNVHNISHTDGIRVIRELSRYQQNMNDIPEKLMGYESNWR